MAFLKSLVAAAVLVAGVSAASAQTATQAPAPAAKAPVTAPAAGVAAPTAAKGPALKKASTPEGIECSAQADAQKLHGKERKAFRQKCVKDMKAAAKGKAAPAAAAAKAPAAPAAAAPAVPAAKKN